MNLRAKAPEVAALEEGNWNFDLQLFADDEAAATSEPTNNDVNVTDDFPDDDGHEINIGEKQVLFDETMQAVDADKEEESTPKEVPESVKREQSPEANAAFAEMRRKAEEAERKLADDQKRRDQFYADKFGKSHGIFTEAQYMVAVEQDQKRQEAQRQQEMQQRPQAVYQQTYQQLIEQGYDQQVAHRMATVEANNVANVLKMQALEDRLAAREKQEQQKSEQQQKEAAINQVLTDHKYLREKYADLVPDIENLDAQTVALMNQGIPLKAAWLAANEDAVIDFAKGKGAQKATREINSKAHLDSEKGGGSGIGKQIHISDEKMQVWRALGFSDKEAKQREARYQRQKRG